MGEQQVSEEQMVQAVYEFAANEMQNGATPQQVQARLVEQGLDTETAGMVVSNLVAARADAIRSAGNKNMLYGALWCVGGLVVTVWTYSAAASAGGGTYVVAWGAILFGAIQFIRGISQAMTR